MELALADVLGISTERLGAFRARIRHLRDSGVPVLPKPGTGSFIDYTAAMALELLVALQLEAVGHAPKHIARMAAKIVEDYLPDERSPTASAYGDMFVILLPPDTSEADLARFDPLKQQRRVPLEWEGNGPAPAPLYFILRGLGVWPYFLEKAPRAFSVLNLTAISRDLAAALDRIAK
jgi:hypothetical protein